MTSKSKTEKTRHNRGRKGTKRPGAGYKPYPVPYTMKCGFCGHEGQVYTDGRMKVCGNCGH